MTNTTIAIAMLSGFLLVSGCATRCDSWCKLSIGAREVLK